MASTHAPYNLEMAESCVNCRCKSEAHFCNLAPPVLEAMAAISYISIYPERAVLFVEGQEPRGVYILMSWTRQAIHGFSGWQEPDFGGLQKPGNCSTPAPAW
jgi:hypothetical protein